MARLTTRTVDASCDRNGGSPRARPARVFDSTGPVSRPAGKGQLPVVAALAIDCQ